MARNENFAHGSARLPLTPAEIRMLKHAENTRYDSLEQRDADLNEKFGLPSHAFFQHLEGIAGHPEAAEHAPKFVELMNRSK